MNKKVKGLFRRNGFAQKVAKKLQSWNLLAAILISLMVLLLVIALVGMALQATRPAIIIGLATILIALFYYWRTKVLLKNMSRFETWIRDRPRGKTDFLNSSVEAKLTQLALDVAEKQQKEQEVKSGAAKANAAQASAMAMEEFFRAVEVFKYFGYDAKESVKAYSGSSPTL